MGMVVQRWDHVPAGDCDLSQCSATFNVSHSLLIPCSNERVEFVGTVKRRMGWDFSQNKWAKNPPQLQFSL